MLGAAGGLSLYDEDLRREFRKNNTPAVDHLADGLDFVGHPVTQVTLAGGIWAYGSLAEYETVTDTGRNALAAVLTAEVVTLGLKAGLGRRRPDNNGDAWSFHPLTLKDSHHSLPSGHASDVVVGALIGGLPGRLTLRKFDRATSLQPSALPIENGVRFVWKWLKL
jgi:hypothetical protein